MTTYTRAQLATRVLKDLGLVAAEEPVSAEDASWVSETIASESAFLAAAGLPIWGGSDQVLPEEYLTVLSRRIGMAIASSFGLMTLTEAQMGMREAERQLAVLASPRLLNPASLRTDDPTGRRSQFDYSTGR